MAEIDDLFHKGLAAGYAGGTEHQTTQRGPFLMEASQYIAPDGGVYRDEWMADRTGGGQEIAQVKNLKASRVYGGGTISLKQLAELGITKKDVTNYLKRKIIELGSQTRTPDRGCFPGYDGDWLYFYQLLEKIPDIPLTVGLETIKYRETRVFAHAFIFTPIE